MKKRCDKHGLEFESQVRVIGDATAELGMCVECAREVNAALQHEGQKLNAVELKDYAAERAQKTQASKFDRIGIPPRFRGRGFDNYQTKDGGQQGALRRAKAYSERLCGGGYGGLILSGQPGTGKTHLACAVGMAFEKTGKSVLFMTVSELIRKLRESYRKDAEQKLQVAINAFRDIDLLILDEVGVQSGSDDELLLLTDVINARYNWMKPTVLISNLSVPDLDPVLGARIIDRMREDGGALIEFDWPSFRTQAAKVHSA